MKIQSLNKINKILITVLFAFTLISCTSTTGQEADEIIKTAIDLGEKYNSLKLYDKSCEVYEKALEEVKDYRLYYNYSISLYCSGSYNEAISICEKAINSTEALDQKLLFLEAKALYEEKSLYFEDAANTLEQIIDLSVENKKLSQDDIEKKYQKLISLLIKAENKEKAYEKALYLWNEGFISKENIEILYSLNPQKWETTFNAIL